MVSGFTSDVIAKWAKASLLPELIVTSDGLGCFAAVTEAGCIHMPRVVGALKPRDLHEFKWINTVLGNLKTVMSGATTSSTSCADQRTTSSRLGALTGFSVEMSRDITRKASVHAAFRALIGTL